MKSVILLLALVVASQAAFTGTLNQQAKPIINDAIVKMRAVSRTSTFRENDIINAIINGIQLQTEHVIAQIDNALEAGQQIATVVVEQIQSTVHTLQTIGEQAVSTATTVVNNFLNSLHGLFNGLATGRADGILTQTIIDIINAFNVEHEVTSVLTHPITQTMAGWVAGLINTLGVTEVVSNAVAAVLGQDFANYLFGHLDINRSIFSGLAGQIQAAAQQVISNVQTAIQQFTAVAAANFVQLQDLVSQTLQQVATQAQENLTAACNQLLETLKPFQQQLGALYQQTVDQINALLGQN